MLVRPVPVLLALAAAAVPRPGRAPKIVRRGIADLPGTAADYFDRPALAPGEGKRDG